MQTTTSSIEALPGTARVWVYMSDRPLSSEETSALERDARAFAASWAAHGQPLAAYAEVRYGRFLILVVDEASHSASGCSIDSSVQFVRSVGEALKVDFFNRLLVSFRDGSGAIQAVSISDFRELIRNGSVGPETVVFNNLVDTRTALETGWELPLQDGPYSRLLPV